MSSITEDLYIHFAHASEIKKKLETCTLVASHAHVCFDLATKCMTWQLVEVKQTGSVTYIMTAANKDFTFKVSDGCSLTKWDAVMDANELILFLKQQLLKNKWAIDLFWDGLHCRLRWKLVNTKEEEIDPESPTDVKQEVKKEQHGFKRDMEQQSSDLDIPFYLNMHHVPSHYDFCISIFEPTEFHTCCKELALVSLKMKFDLIYKEGYTIKGDGEYGPITYSYYSKPYVSSSSSSDDIKVLTENEKDKKPKKKKPQREIMSIDRHEKSELTQLKITFKTRLFRVLSRSLTPNTLVQIYLSDHMRPGVVVLRTIKPAQMCHKHITTKELPDPYFIFHITQEMSTEPVLEPSLFTCAPMLEDKK